MGLNLNIRRIIFNELTKFDGVEIRQPSSPEVKQIAGRAGRYKMSYYDKGGGVVTTRTMAWFLMVIEKMAITRKMIS